MDKAIKQALIDIVGEENFTDHLIDLVSYAYDASDHDHRPEAALWPSSAAQVSKVLILANEHRFPVTARGAGTGLAGGRVRQRAAPRALRARCARGFCPTRVL